MLLQLSPTIPVDSPRGPADCHVLIDYGTEHAVLFLCAIRATGEFWCFKQSEIKLEKNITMGVRTRTDADIVAEFMRQREEVK